MKFFVAFLAVAAVASAVPLQHRLISPGPVGPTPVVDENGSPIAVGPAILDLSPISVGPAVIDFPLPDGGAISAVEPAIITPTPVVEPVVPSPVVIGEVPAGAQPLVQIIVKVNGQDYTAVVPTPADNAVVEDEVIVPGPVNIVDNVVPIAVEPIQVVEPVIPGPVNVVDNVVPIAVEPVQVVEPVIPGPVNIVDNVVPVVVEPVQIVEPTIPIAVEPVQVAEPSFPGLIVPVPIPDILN